MHLFKNNPKRRLIIALFSCFLLWAVLLQNLANAATCVVAGTGDSEHVLLLLGREFQKTHPEDKIIVPESVGSNGGIHALLAGKTCLARIARPLRKEEKKQGLVSLIFAASPVVFAVNQAAWQLDGISSAQIMALYEGKIKRWEELDSRLGSLGRIYPITREFGDATIRIVKKVFPAFKNLPPHKLPIYYSTPDAVQALLDHKRAIGFLPMPEAVHAGLHILKIDNKTPNIENVASGNYKLVEPFSIVYLKELQGLQKDFVNFLFTERARQLIMANNILPVKAGE